MLGQHGLVLGAYDDVERTLELLVADICVRRREQLSDPGHEKLVAVCKVRGSSEEDALGAGADGAVVRCGQLQEVQQDLGGRNGLQLATKS